MDGLFCFVFGWAASVVFSLLTRIWKLVTNKLAHFCNRRTDQEEEVAVEDNSSEQQFGVFKDFDFLDVELEDAEVRIWAFIIFIE